MKDFFIYFFDIFKNINYNLILIYIFSIAFILFFSDFIARFFLKNKRKEVFLEIQRKIPHIFIGFLFVSSVFFLKKEGLLLFSLIVFLASIFNFFVPVFLKISEVKRKSLGIFLFPLGIFFLTLFFYNQKEAFIFGILVLTISDSLAAFFGKEFGNKKIFKNNKNNKTCVGSFVFFLITFLLFLIIKTTQRSLYSEDISWENIFYKEIFNLDFLFLIFWAFFFSLFLTITELFLIFGTDNFILPILGAFLFTLI